MRAPSILHLVSAAAFALSCCDSAFAQELVVTPSHDYSVSGPRGDPVIIFADVSANLQNPSFVYVAPDATPLKAHALALLSANRAAVSHIANTGGGRIDIIDTTTAQVIDSLAIPDYATDGLGTYAVDPATTHLFVFSGLSASKLFVVPLPISATSIASEVAMPSNGGTAQTHAISFDRSTGRAYVGHVSGISALDPPYTSIAFTIALPPSSGYIRGRAVALSPDGATLASTIYRDNLVQVIRAPFSASSMPTALTVTGAVGLDALQFTPNGSQLLIVDAPSSAGRAAEVSALSAGVAKPATTTSTEFAIAAPFDAAATVEVLDTGLLGQDFEDIDISADGKLAVLGGGSENLDAPLVILRAPFTAAGVSVYPITITPLNGGYDSIGGRGTGAARFWSSPAPVLPQLAPDLVVNVTEGDAGTAPMNVAVRLSSASRQTIHVDYATSDLSADFPAPTRYLATSGTLTFAPGETFKTVSIPIVGNVDEDGSGAFQLTFSNPVNASLLDTESRVRCSVTDNDGLFVIDTPSPLPDAFVGVPYSKPFAAEGSTSGYGHWLALSTISSNIAAVPGLTMDPDSGMFSGTPTAAGSYTFRVWVGNAANTVTTSRGYQMTVLSDRIFADDFEAKR